MILQVLLARLGGWIQRYQSQVITSLQASNCVLTDQLGGQRLSLTGIGGRGLAA
jgi:hypothetical protein